MSGSVWGRLSDGAFYHDCVNTKIHMNANLIIEIDDLESQEIQIFLSQHLQDMKSTSPPENNHALDIDSLKDPEITFWSGKLDNSIVACGAIKLLRSNSAEIKSMRVCPYHRGQGYAEILLAHIIEHSRSSGVHSLLLETGSMDFFRPARRLYEKFGFRYCNPFADYKPDPNSVFMCLILPKSA